MPIVPTTIMSTDLTGLLLALLAIALPLLLVWVLLGCSERRKAPRPRSGAHRPR